MARTVEDLRVLLEATRGYDPGDPVSTPVPILSEVDIDPRSLRIGFYDDDGYNPVSLEVRTAIHQAAALLAESGFIVEPFRPHGLERARQLWFTLFVEAIATVLRPMVRGRENETTGNTREFLAFAAEQPALTGERLLMTLLERDQLRSQFLEQMEQFPILLAPVCSIPAFLPENAGWGSAHAADYARTMSYSQHYNLLGNPAATVPVAWTSTGLPIGVQIIGRPYKEDEALAVAAVLDRQFGWKKPPVTGSTPRVNGKVPMGIP